MKKYVTIKGVEIELLENTDYRDNKINKLLNKINEILLTLDETEPEWNPKLLKEGDIYWYIDDKGMPQCDKWHDDSVDDYRLKMNNVFQAEQDAIEARDKIMNK